MPMMNFTFRFNMISSIYFIEAGNFLFFSFNQVRFRLILTIFSIHDPPKGVPNGVGAL